MAEVIAHDGRPLRDTSDPDGPSLPVRDTGHPMVTDVVAFGAAERYDLLLHPPAVGTFLLEVDFLHWATMRTLATRRVLLEAR